MPGMLAAANGAARARGTALSSSPGVEVGADERVSEASDAVAAAALPLWFSLAILFFLANWNSFLWPLTVASDQDLWVVQVGIANFRGQYSTSWNYIMAASTIVAAPMLILFVIFQRQIMDSIKTSGLK